MTRSCEATCASRSAVELTSREREVVLGRPDASDLALSRVRQAIICVRKIDSSHNIKPTDREFVGGIANYIFGTRTGNETASKQENFLCLLSLSRCGGGPPEIGKQILALLEHRTTKLRQVESRLVEFLVIVFSICDLADWGAQIPSSLFRTQDKADLTRGVSWDRGVRILRDGEDATSHGLEFRDKWEM